MSANSEIILLRGSLKCRARTAYVGIPINTGANVAEPNLPYFFQNRSALRSFPLNPFLRFVRRAATKSLMNTMLTAEDNAAPRLNVSISK